MIIVKDKTEERGSYKAHPCFAVHIDCPCRPCFNCHDCTPPNREHTNEVYSKVFHCATNWNKGCPEPEQKAEHIFKPHSAYCSRCGMPKKKACPKPPVEETK